MAGMATFVSKGYFDFLFNIGVGLLLIFYSYKLASLAKAKSRPVPFLQLRLLRILGVIMLVGTLLWSLISLLLWGHIWK